MQIIIGGDFVPTEKNYKAFMEGDSAALFGKALTSFLEQGDFNIFNLEMPLTDTQSPITKCGPVLSAPTKCVSGYVSANSKLLCLANNHILDQGEEGLSSTIKCLSDVAIDYVGAGCDLQAAATPYIKRIGQITIGVYACAETEFSIADDKQAGANPFDPLETLDHIYMLKKECDYLIVLYHGGKEFYRYPSPDLQKRCRKLIEKGADIVVCQHSHCIGAHEEYNGKEIVYGQGNFLFDHGNDEYWNSGLLVSIDIDSDKRKMISFVPIVKEAQYVRLAEKDVKERILQGFEERSSHLADSQFISEQYSRFAQKKLNGYLSACLGRTGSSFFGRAINIISKRKIWKRFFSKKNLVTVLDFVECEAHRELFIRGLQEEIDNRQATQK